MRFGIQVGTYLPGGWSAAQVREHIRQIGAAASEHHFDGLFAGQRYLAGKDTAIPQPLPLLANLAGMAPEMYVGTSVFLLPLHDPVQVAEQTATLDVLSGGRFLFGIGLGYQDAEFEAFGIDKRTRRQRAQEAVEVIRRLWVEDDVDHNGTFFHLRGATINPKPHQRPGPRILVGADTLTSVQRAPELGDYWLPSRRHSKAFLRTALPAYRTALERQGRPFTGLPMYRDLCVAETSQEAEVRVRTAYEAIYRRFSQAQHPGESYNLSFDELKQDRLIIGSPEEVRDHVLEYHREFGVEFMWFAVQWPGMDSRWSLETIRLFGDEVIPQIKKLTGPGRIP